MFSKRSSGAIDEELPRRIDAVSDQQFIYFLLREARNL